MNTRTLSPDVVRLLDQRYLKPGEDWESMVSRVVSSVCSGEDVKHQMNVFDDIIDRIWLPNSPCLVNAGTTNGGLMACFVVGPTEDTLEAHVEALGDIATVGKRGGGCGFSGTFIRPEGSPVAGSAHGYAYGPNAWALRVSDYLDMITQGGFRKMALMYSLSSDHEDLDAFIDLKHTKDERFCYNFNQSIFASDAWMYNASTNGGGQESRQLAKLIHNAWGNGEPGLLFSDTINTETPYGKETCSCHIYTTNPCGEQPLPTYGSCNLGSINLSHSYFMDNGSFDFTHLERVVRTLTRFLDSVGSRNVFPNHKFASWYNAHRPVGIGVMGYADALLKMGYAYGSPDGVNFLRDAMETIYMTSYSESIKLGKERGVPEHCRGFNRRNITTVSIAPTGSIGFLAECSHGIEPVFSPVYKRTDERGDEYMFVHGMANEDHFRSSINGNKGKMPTWREHIETQAAAQEFTDSAVSKTINMFNGVTEDDVRNAMLYAWELGCKGITIYRDGSRKFQVLEDLTEEDSLLVDCPTGVCDL